MARQQSSLLNISPDRIRKNPDNPRLIFHEDEMNQLLESISEVGIKVPLSVYRETDTKYVLIDGERRWKCARKLNLLTVPAIIQPKPSPLENLLMMFNIHNVRVQWDLMPMALKLDDVRKLLKKEGKEATPRALAAITGVNLATVKRGLELLNMPQKYRKMLMEEARKPRAKQRVKADLFIEIFKSVHTIERYIPEVFDSVPKSKYIDAMVKKYMDKVVDNVVAFREISKIARAERTGVARQKAIPVIKRLATNRRYKIEDAYSDTVKLAYDRRDILTRLTSLTERLTDIRRGTDLDEETKKALRDLRKQITRLLG